MLLSTGEKEWMTGLFLVCAALAAGAHAQAQAPCCSITAIDAKTEVVTAKVNASGAEFQFRVTNANLVKGLRVGQGVYANLTAKQVSLDGKSACCTIMSTPTAAPLRPPVTASIPAGAALSGTGPCCSVTAVSYPSLITAQTSGGAYFTFSLNADPLLPLLHVSVSVNQKVYANFTTKQVSLDGTSAVGTIKYLCPVPQNQPCPARDRPRDCFAVQRDFVRREIRVHARADAHLFQQICVRQSKLERCAIRIYLGGDHACRRINRGNRTTGGLGPCRSCKRAAEKNPETYQQSAHISCLRPNDVACRPELSPKP